VRGQTLSSPGIAETQAHCPADAAIVRIPGKDKALAITTDCTPRYCFADPFEGAKQAVAESWRNLCAVGATPLAVTNNLNFGNPQKPPIMAQFVAGVEGIAAACAALDYPVISGNVSLYNETNGEAIFPTPAIGGVGVIADWTKVCGLAVREDGLSLILIGGAGAHLGQTLYLREILGREDGPPPPVDLAMEKKHGLFIRELIAQGVLAACHDISDGGLLVALAEMLMAGGTGAEILAGGDTGFWFGEDQSRYVIATRTPDSIHDLATKAGIPALTLGLSGGKTLKIGADAGILVSHLIDTNERWLPAFMEGSAKHGDGRGND
jgi:phosphoribosylformylglycinamidine synthase